MEGVGVLSTVNEYTIKVRGDQQFRWFIENTKSVVKDSTVFIHILDVGLDTIPESIFDINISGVLTFENCAFSCIPAAIGRMYKLRELHLINCNNIATIDSSLSENSNIRNISIQRCNKLNFDNWRNVKGKMFSITNIHFDECDSITDIPFVVKKTPSPRCKRSSLYIRSCKSLESISGGLCGFAYITLISCPNLRVLHSNLCDNSILRHLHIENCDGIVCLPDKKDKLIPESMEHVYVKNNANLKSIDCISGCIHNTSEFYVFDNPVLALIL